MFETDRMYIVPLCAERALTGVCVAARLDGSSG
jgi:hypothetical protein